MGNKYDVYQDQSDATLYVYIGSGKYVQVDQYMAGEGQTVMMDGDTEGDLVYVGTYGPEEMGTLSI